MNDWRMLRVPASSANLGPGFDGLALALNVYLKCRFRKAPGLAIRAQGRDQELISTGEDNLIWRIALECGAHEPIELEIDNEIPIGKGMGSSAAAVTAGVVIASEISACGWNRARVLEETARQEGHPDNVAACALGGLIASAVESNGCAHAVKLPVDGNCRVAVVVPDFRLPTRESRLALPDLYSRLDTIFNVQHATLLVAALVTGDRTAFPAALRDRMHQPYRCPLVPGLEQILALRAPGLLGCALSGAGPSVLVFYERGHENVCELAARAFTDHGHRSEILYTEIPDCGYQLL